MGRCAIQQPWSFFLCGPLFVSSLWLFSRYRPFYRQLFSFCPVIFAPKKQLICLPLLSLSLAFVLQLKLTSITDSHRSKLNVSYRVVLNLIQFDKPYDVSFSSGFSFCTAWCKCECCWKSFKACQFAFWLGRGCFF